MWGFSRQEQGIILFLLLSLSVGGAVSLYKRFVARDQMDNHLTVEQKTVEEFRELSDRIKSETGASFTRGADGTSENVSGRQQAVQEARVEPNDGNDRLAKVNINTASAKELQAVPRIGPVLAQRIIAYRQSNGRFDKMEQLKKVKGIGDMTYEQLHKYLKLN